MRTNSPTYGPLLKRVRADSMGNGNVKLIYGVENQPPDHFLAAQYRIGGSDPMTSQLCAGSTGADPRFPYLCSSEALLEQSYIAYYLQNNENCTYSNIRVTGGFADPFVYAYDTSTGGYLYLNGPGAERRLEWSTNCVGWSAPRADFVIMTKIQSYECKAGFKGINARTDMGFTTTARSPNFCIPTGGAPYITTRVKQCEGCNAKDGNPAVASTGNKEYRTTDFTWEGLGFTRAYNSVRDFPTDAGLGGNWSHGFSDRLGFGPYLSWVRGDGYVEYFEYVDATHYKPRSQVGVALLKGSDATVPGSAYRLLRGITTRWFDANGRMLQLRAGGKDFYLYYCDAAGIAAGTCTELDSLIAVNSDTNRLLTFVREPATGDFPFRSNGKPSTVITRVLADGAPLIDYHYDNQGRLIDAIPSGQVSGTRYFYAEENLICRNNDGSAAAGCDPADFPYHLTGVEDEADQRFATYSYDANGRVLNSEHAGGVERVALNYASNTSVAVSLPLGASKTYGFTSGAYSTLPSSATVTATNGVTSTISYAYTADRITNRTVNGMRTDYAYNNYQQTSVTKGLTSAGAGTSAKRVTQTDWDANLQLPTERRIYDAAGTLVHKEVWTYNSRGQVLTHSVNEL